MRMLTIAALLITFPALAVIGYGLLTGRPLWVLGAVASLLVNSLPFLTAILLLRRNQDTDLAGH